MVITVYTDFDETLVKENSPMLLVKSMLAFYKRVFGRAFALSIATKTIYNGVLYKLTRKTKHYYNAHYYFDSKILIDVSSKLTVNEKWVAAIDLIRKQHGNDKIELTIISRNVIELIEDFVKINKSFFKSQNIVVKKIIAHASFLFSGETVIHPAKSEGGLLIPTDEKKFTKATKVVEFKVIPDSEFRKQLSAYIENKKDFLSGGFFIGDKDDAYLRGLVPNLKFIRV
jgi:hypothetical protein